MVGLRVGINECISVGVDGIRIGRCKRMIGGDGAGGCRPCRIIGRVIVIAGRRGTMDGETDTGAGAE